ncbi:MAG: alpha/beta hydrolase [Bacilli bacterium]|nr:alpha/beta hydrolase [Bacilli bacterium]
MTEKINDIELNYYEYGEGKKTLIFLHGWGQNIEMMKPLADYFYKEYKIYIIDLPGHGKSSEPTFAYHVDDFVDVIRKFIEKKKIKNFTLIGHSFGGKVSLLYQSKYHDADKLIMLACSFKKEIEKLSFKTKMLKFAKKIPGLNKLEGFAKKHIGSADYKNASGIMREVLVNAVNQDIREDIKKIETDTLLIWGDQDEAVSIESAHELDSILPSSGLVVFPGCTHYAYLENLGGTVSVIRSFLES